MKNHQLIITGIGTDVGKTIVSAIIAEALRASYWKPIQAGDLDNSDSIKLKALTERVTVMPEAFRLTQPMSPHAAAKIDGVQIHASDLKVPEVEGNLIIEGAGGLMVPMNSDGLTYADVFERWKLPVVIVSRHYLGSINHTLMTAEILRSRTIPVLGIVFVGDENKDTESIILRSTGLKMLARVPIAEVVDKEFIKEQASSAQIQYSFI